MKMDEIQAGKIYFNGDRRRQVVMIRGIDVYYRKPKGNVVAYTSELSNCCLGTFAKWAKGEAT